ncbi:WAS/WASL-interacting protein family member 3 isoform A [Alligator mississippiensis]|uniref:WAS/WASL-interacting protein family member 3 isoform A n=1 Tax=Alligator mississippiensis TaxID=8496 RepID=A0A151MQP6_ALLMI|nr:WAS/WASL-interacting protein family member 3 isoform A [Alligator mississippiensis]
MFRPFFTASTEPPKPRKEDQKARSALLADIQHGTLLRKVAQINDRSAPQIEKSKGPNRDGNNSANTRSAQPSLGGLFAGGFPVLRPAGQRDMTAGKAGQLPGAQAPLPRPLSPMNNNMKTCSNFSNPPDGAKPEIRDYLHPTPPPPLPPLLPTYTPSSTKPSLPLLPSPAPSRDINSSDVPPPLPPKSPYLLSQFQKPNIQSMPLPPTLPFPQPPAAVQKRRPGRVAVSGAGKLPLPPQPPARSPTTELTSKSPYAQAGPWPAREPSPQLRNGNMPIVDDFESKFTFHSVEDFPPPDEFKPFQRIYPSKEPRDAPKNPLLRTHSSAYSAGQSWFCKQLTEGAAQLKARRRL